jgi:hypothetical protein
MNRTDTAAPPIALHVTDEDRSHGDTVYRFALHGALLIATRDRFKAAALEELANVVARHTHGALKIRIDFTHLSDSTRRASAPSCRSSGRCARPARVVHAVGLQEDLAKLFRGLKLDGELTVEVARG